MDAHVTSISLHFGGGFIPLTHPLNTALHTALFAAHYKGQNPLHQFPRALW